MNLTLVERLTANSTKKAWLLFYRPPKPENSDKPYSFDSQIIMEENKFWRRVNNLSNMKYEYKYHVIELPYELFPNKNIHIV